MRRGGVWVALWVGWCVSLGGAEKPADVTAARQALERGVAFFHRQVASHGGYVYLYSADLSRREGEGKTTTETLWVQPPGTPAVGLALLQAYQRTNDPACLTAARDAATCLLQGQYRSGGWNASIEFAPEERAKHAYRVDPPPKNSSRRQRNTSSLDDDKTQSALRFLMQLDQTLKFQDQAIHEATRFALDALLQAQFPNGAWAQVWMEPADRTQSASRRASYPAEWSRTYPGGDYWFHYTFNDNNISQTIDTLLLAEKVYGEPRFREAALRAGEFILLAQMPEPQPAWAQQYNFDMQPAWARKFEPPAISGGESQRLIGTLLDLYEVTGDSRFLQPVPKALDYLQRSQLPDGRLARFYELQTNRPLYLTRTYQLTYSDDDLPTHYGFQVGSQVDKLRQRYEAVRQLTPAQLTERQERVAGPVQVSSRLREDVRKLVAAQDDRGAWVESGRLKYHGSQDDTRQVISSDTFIRNLDRISEYLAAAGQR